MESESREGRKKPLYRPPIGLNKEERIIPSVKTLGYCLIPERSVAPDETKGLLGVPKAAEDCHSKTFGDSFAASTYMARLRRSTLFRGAHANQMRCRRLQAACLRSQPSNSCSVAVSPLTSAPTERGDYSAARSKITRDFWVAASGVFPRLDRSWPSRSKLCISE